MIDTVVQVVDLCLALLGCLKNDLLQNFGRESVVLPEHNVLSYDAMVQNNGVDNVGTPYSTV